jgi:hypothetical protein
MFGIQKAGKLEIGISCVIWLVTSVSVISLIKLYQLFWE